MQRWRRRKTRDNRLHIERGIRNAEIHMTQIKKHAIDKKYI